MAFWDRDKGKANTGLKKNYMSQPDELLREYATEHHDVKAWAALVLKKQNSEEVEI